MKLVRIYPLTLLLLSDDSERRLSVPVEAPALAPRIKLVDYLRRKDMQHVYLPPGVHTLPAFAALKVNMEERAESECGDADVPHLTPL